MSLFGGHLSLSLDYDHPEVSDFIFCSPLYLSTKTIGWPIEDILINIY